MSKYITNNGFDSLLSYLGNIISKKANKENNDLTTNDKRLVGAINEINNNLNVNGIPFKFGINGNGQYGYILDDGDAVEFVPFVSTASTGGDDGFCLKVSKDFANQPFTLTNAGVKLTGVFDENAMATVSLSNGTWKLYCCGEIGYITLPYSYSFTFEEKALIPIMTSNNTSSDSSELTGIVTAGSIYSSDYDVYKAFDGDDSTYWAAKDGVSLSDAWATYEFPKPVFAVRVDIGTANDSRYIIYGAEIYASNDGATWDKLGEMTRTSNTSTTVELNTNKGYKIYKFQCTQISSLGADINRIQLYGYA